MTKPISNKISIKNTGDFYARKDIKLHTKRGKEIDAEVLLRFHAPSREYMCYLHAPTLDIRHGVTLIIEKWIAQRKTLYFMHSTRDKSIDEAAETVLRRFGEKSSLV